MKNILKIFASGLFLMDVVPLAAQVPAGGKNCFSEGLAAFEIHGEGAEIQKIAEGHYRVAARGGFGQPWDAQWQAPVPCRVERGDVFLAEFHLRAVSSQAESAEVRSEFVFERAGEPWTKSASHPIRAGREWVHFFIPFSAVESYEPSGAQAIFRLGYEKPQVLELKDFHLWKYGRSRSLSDLPKTKVTYSGREADASWRKAAAERIERYRKADFKLQIQDEQDRPVKGANVRVELLRHRFGLGTAVSSQELLFGIYVDRRERYKKEIPALFTWATVENAFKWPAWEGEWGGQYGKENALKTAKWLKEQGLKLRGHVLVWPSWRNLPKRLQAFKDDPKRLRKEVIDHIRELTAAGRGLMDHWDVLNEPFDNHDLMDLLGEKEMVRWFQEARRGDPNAILFLNDYAILSGGGGNTAHRDHYEKTIRFLLKNGAPLDAIGMQGHFGLALTDPQDLLSILDRYATFGKPIWVTEYDIAIDDENLAADYTRDFYTILFSHPAVEGAVMWGFWDGAHWGENAPLFTRDWQWKKSGLAWKELFTKTWYTQETGASGSNGEISFRGFLGRYKVVAEKDGRRRSWEIDVAPKNEIFLLKGL